MAGVDGKIEVSKSINKLWMVSEKFKSIDFDD